jgi:hypothetical protein
MMKNNANKKKPLISPSPNIVCYWLVICLSTLSGAGHTRENRLDAASGAPATVLEQHRTAHRS